MEETLHYEKSQILIHKCWHNFDEDLLTKSHSLNCNKKCLSFCVNNLLNVVVFVRSVLLSLLSLN